MAVKQLWPTKLYRGLRTWWQVIKGLSRHRSVCSLVGHLTIWVVILTILDNFAWLVDHLTKLVIQTAYGVCEVIWVILSFEGFVPKLPVCILGVRFSKFAVKTSRFDDFEVNLGYQTPYGVLTKVSWISHYSVNPYMSIIGGWTPPDDVCLQKRGFYPL